MTFSTNPVTRRIVLVLGFLLSIVSLWFAKDFGYSRSFGGSARTVSQSATSASVELDADVLLERISQSPSPDVQYVRIQFVDHSSGWLTDHIRLWRTNDGGRGWHLLRNVPRGDIAIFQFVNPLLGWIEADRRLFRTEDGGDSWIELPQPIPSPPGGNSRRSVFDFTFFPDGLKGWLVGGIYEPPRRVRNGEAIGQPPSRYLALDGSGRGLVGAVFSTPDAGETWRQELTTSKWGYLSRVFFLGADNAWVTGLAGAFYLDGHRWKSMDDGGRDEYGQSRVRALSLQPGGPDEVPLCVYFLDRTLGWISNRNGYVGKSIDGGRTWQDLGRFDDGSDITSYSYDLYFSSPAEGWALSGQGHVYKTRDGGVTWSKVEAGSKVSGMFFLDPENGWLVAKSGIFRIGR